MYDILMIKMRYILLILWLVFIALQATIPAIAVAGPKTTENVLRTEWPELDFNVAYEHFTKGNLSAASLEIRKGANFLYTIADSSEGKIKEDLLRSYDELIRLSVDTQ
jgi:hypothetical protein